MKCWRSVLPLLAKIALGLGLTAQITTPSARTVQSESGGRPWLAQPWPIAKVVATGSFERHQQWATLYTFRSPTPAAVHPAPGNLHSAEHMGLNSVSTAKWAEIHAICNATGWIPERFENSLAKALKSPVVDTNQFGKFAS